MDSYTFHTPIGFLTIREEEQKLTNLSTECFETVAEDSVRGDEKLPGDCDWYRQ